MAYIMGLFNGYRLIFLYGGPCACVNAPSIGFSQRVDRASQRLIQTGGRSLEFRIAPRDDETRERMPFDQARAEVCPNDIIP